MSETLKFNRIYYKKHNTSKIKIKNGTLVLNEDCDIVKIDKTEYDYQKAVVELDDQDLYDLMSGWENQINKYLEDQKVTPITILYDNKVYPKVCLDNLSNASVIKIKGVWINDENKPFLQLWLELKKKNNRNFFCFKKL